MDEGKFHEFFCAAIRLALHKRDQSAGGSEWWHFYDREYRRYQLKLEALEEILIK